MPYPSFPETGGGSGAQEPACAVIRLRRLRKSGFLHFLRRFRKRGGETHPKVLAFGPEWEAVAKAANQVPPALPRASSTAFWHYGL